ncbi:MAG: glycosyltransferase [Salibacteraceae bacterium]
MDKKFKILALASWYPNDTDPQLGIFIKHQLKAISQIHNIDLITLRPAPNKRQETIIENGITHQKHYYVTNQYPIKKLSWYVAWMEIINKIPKDKYDFIHLHVIYPMGIIALKVKSQLNIPLITSEHWSGYHSNFEYSGILRKRFTKKTIQLSSAVVVQSKFLQKLMEEQKLKANYKIVPNIVDFKLASTNSIIQEKCVIMNIADHIDSDKNISGILRAFAQSLQSNPHLKLIQIGSGPDQLKLHLLSKELGISDHVIWRGRLPNKEVLKEIQTCDFGIINSNRETFCISAFEFLASEKPIIITKCGGPEEYLPNIFGVEILTQNDSQLTTALLEMATNYKSYNLKESASAIRNQFSNESFLESINKIYNSVV